MKPAYRLMIGLMVLIAAAVMVYRRAPTPTDQPVQPTGSVPAARQAAAPSHFVKLDEHGRDLPENANAWRCVRDRSTGLVWETKTREEGLHNVEHNYLWLEPDMQRNGGYPGFPDFTKDPEKARKNPRQPVAVDPDMRGELCGHVVEYCNTHAFTEAVNHEGLCGFRDWRLPALPELATLTDFSRSHPATDPRFFPKTEGFRFWSATTRVTRVTPETAAEQGQEAWAVDSVNGAEEGARKNDYMSVRLVRGQMAETP